MSYRIDTRSLSGRLRVVAVIAAAAVLTGCGSSGSGGASAQGVASLPATGSPRPSPSGSSVLPGVTIPDNATQAQLTHIMNAYASCQETHGDTAINTKSDGMMVPEQNSAQRYPGAVKACQSIQPHPPWQEMPQYNPNYQQDEAAWVNCMNARGVPVQAVPGGWNYNGPSRLSGLQRHQVYVECEMKSFNEH
jgi:hypothetical protein